jgi:hypothetical protein
VRKRLIALLAFLLAGALAQLGAQTATVLAPPEADKGLMEGVRLSPVPEILYAQVPALHRGQGVVVEELPEESALARQGVRKHDILLTLDKVPIRDGKHLSQMLTDGKAAGPRQLSLLRRGKEMTVAVDALGPETVLFPKAMLKAGAPPAVNVEAQPMGQNKLKVVLTFYSNSNGKLEQVTCSGSLGEIEAEVRQLGRQKRLPPRVQDLVDVAMKRIRDLNPTEQP